MFSISANTAPSRSGISEAVLRRYDRWIDRHWVWMLTALCAIFSIQAMRLAAARPLDHDEIYTLYVAQQPALADVYTALAQHADNHPPVDYWMRHISLQLFGTSELAVRLPSIVAVVGTVLCLFAFARRLFGTTSAFVAVCVFLISHGAATAYFGRNYSLMLFWTMSGLLAWQLASERIHRRICLVLLATLFASAICVSYYAPIHLACVVAAELARTWRRRAVDGPIWACFGCSFAGLALVKSLVEYASSFAGRFWTPVTVSATVQVYGELFANAYPAIALVLVVWVLLQGVPAPSTRPSVSCSPPVALAAAVYLAGLPVVLFVVAKLKTHAFGTKYSISAVIGFAVLIAFAASRSERFRPSALLGIGAFALVATMMRGGSLGRFDGGLTPADLRAIASNTDGPIVLDDGVMFVQAAYYADPATRSRLFYILDENAAFEFTGGDTIDHALPGLVKLSGFQAVPRAGFIRAHPRFLLLHRGGWVLPAFVRAGASARIIEKSGKQLIEVDVSGR
jgi:4-amino-4-deoxy-L-arabinose transferase-like glycosyltransferase